jgi:hypothetical protein
MQVGHSRLAWREPRRATACRSSFEACHASRLQPTCVIMPISGKPEIGGAHLRMTTGGVSTVKS